MPHKKREQRGTAASANRADCHARLSLLASENRVAIPVHLRIALTAAVLTTLPTGVLSAQSKIDFAETQVALEVGNVTTFGNIGQNFYILETTGTGVAVFDYDSDGDNDLVIANGTTLERSKTGRSPLSHLYRNDGEKFTEVGAQAGLSRRGWGQGVCVGDYDNDGNPDVAMGYFGGPALYHNTGEGGFVEVAEKSGLEQDGRWSAACAFLDYDNDGLLDLFFSSYVDLDLATTPKPGENPDCNWKGLPVMCGPRGLPTAKNMLFHNVGGGKFVDVSEAAGIRAPGGRYGLGVTAADFNNDGLVDIYVACDMTASLLYINQGDGTFEETGALSGSAFNMDGQLQAGMGVAVADYDGNGYLDIVKTNFSGDLPSLYNNEDGVFFEDRSASAGLGQHQLLGWGVLFEDFDADSWPDILIANGHVYPEVDQMPIGETYSQPTILYRNRGDGRFEDISKNGGPALKTNRPARGMASGDLDGDGRPEVVIVNINAAPSVLRNRAEQGNFVSLKLEGTKSNRSAIGARVRVTSGGRTQLRDVTGGGSYFSQSDFTLFFGLGEAFDIEAITVRWPSGAEQEFKNVGGNTRYHLVEGKGLVSIRP